MASWRCGTASSPLRLSPRCCDCSAACKARWNVLTACHRAMGIRIGRERVPSVWPLQSWLYLPGQSYFFARYRPVLQLCCDPCFTLPRQSICEVNSRLVLAQHCRQRTPTSHNLIITSQRIGHAKYTWRLWTGIPGTCCGLHTQVNTAASVQRLNSANLNVL